MPPDKGFKQRLFTHWGEQGLGLYSLVGCFLTIVIVGLVAWALQLPMLVPSLGPTVLLFFESPLQAAACPRNALLGHGIAIAAGWSSLAAFGLLHSPSALSAGLSINYVGAGAVSVAVTVFVKHLVQAPHPPAGATTLIISLGLLTTPAQVGSLAAGVVLITAAAWLTNRLLGVPMPLWRALPKSRE